MGADTSEYRPDIAYTQQAWRRQQGRPCCDYRLQGGALGVWGGQCRAGYPDGRKPSRRRSSIEQMKPGTRMAAEDKWRNVAAVKYALFIALLLPVFALFTPRASAEEPLKGVALVIGESAYQALPALPSPGRDARAIKD